MVVAMKDDDEGGFEEGVEEVSWGEIGCLVGCIQKGDVDVMVVVSAVICNKENC